MTASEPQLLFLPALFYPPPLLLPSPCATQLGVPLPSQQEYVTKGTVRHPKSGKIGISREDGNVTFSRSGLAQYLIDQARQRYPTSIRFHFNAACAGKDMPWQGDASLSHACAPPSHVVFAAGACGDWCCATGFVVTVLCATRF